MLDIFVLNVYSIDIYYLCTFMALSQRNQQKSSDLRISESKENPESPSYVHMWANAHVQKYLLETSGPKQKIIIMAKFGWFDDEWRVLSTNRDQKENTTRINSSSLDLIDFEEDEDDNITYEPVTKLWEILRKLEDLWTDVYLPFELKGEKWSKSLQVPDEYAQMILSYTDKDDFSTVNVAVGKEHYWEFVKESMIWLNALVIWFTQHGDPIVYSGNTGPQIAKINNIKCDANLKVGSLVAMNNDDGVSLSRVSDDNTRRISLDKEFVTPEKLTLQWIFQPAAMEISSVLDPDKMMAWWNYRLEKSDYDMLPELKADEVKEGLEVRSKQWTPGKIISTDTPKGEGYVVVEYYREQKDSEWNRSRKKRSVRALTLIQNIKKKVY